MSHDGAPRPEPEPEPDAGSKTEPEADAWAGVLQAGAALLLELAARRPSGAAPLIRIERDPESGQPGLRLPMPDATLLRQLAKALVPWSKG